MPDEKDIADEIDAMPEPDEQALEDAADDLFESHHLAVPTNWREQADNVPDE